jgi:hypothetical protein
MVPLAQEGTVTQRWDTQQIMGHALDEVDRECQEEPRHSYYALVPKDLRKAIDRLVDNNFPYYCGLFGNDRNEFREQMARNWLVKRRAFAALAERAGLTEIRSGGSGHGLERSNEASFAILTRNASYLLVGPGAFGRKGEGAAYRYRRIPLREAEQVPNMEGHGGFRFKRPPRVGHRAVSSKIATSPVVSVYGGVLAMEEAEGVRSDLGSGVDQTFSGIDTVTLTGWPPRLAGK